MTINEKTAVAAVKKIIRKKQKNYVQVWESTKSLFTHSIPSIKKPCPKNAFVGLVNAGYIKGISESKSIKPNKNAEYAIEAIKVLIKNPRLADERGAVLKLWEKTSGKNITMNGQMHVVIALWRNKLIVGS